MTGPPGKPSGGDPRRRAKLLAAKLRVLVKGRWPDAAGREPEPAAGAVAVRDDDRAWVLVDDASGARGFARALLWGLHHRMAELNVLVEGSPTLDAAARQAACFRTPVAVWAVRGTELVRVDPAPLPLEPPLDPDAEPFIPVIEAAGAEPVIEWGTLTAEVLGLQIGRVRTDEDGTWLEAGIGEHDRMATRLSWGDLPPGDALSRVVEVAVAARRSGDPTHPLNRLGRERWLRHRVVRTPALVDASLLEPASPPAPLTDLRSPLVAPAAGTATGGSAILVACSVGFDPTFVPMAAELHTARARSGRAEELTLVVPEGDLHPLTRLGATGLRVPATIRTVPDDWYAEPSFVPESP